MATSAEATPSAAQALERARRLDSADPLRSFRGRFVDGEAGLVYLDGNSLGPLPRATVERLSRVVRDEWGREVVRAWDRWLSWPLSVGELIGTEIVGASPGQVAMGDSTTVNLYRLAVSAIDARPGRKVIIAARDEFPTDRYVLEGLAERGGLTLRWLTCDPVEGPTAADLAAVIGDDVALVVLSLVNYRSAAFADMAALNAVAHSAGTLLVWDLSHAAGSVPIRLDADGADLAVGCSYKYLNGGPGAPAFFYVRRELQTELRTPIQGWFGQRDQFAMGPAYDPEPGIRAWLAGTPGILALAAVEEGVKLAAEAGMEAIRAKGIALTEFAIELLDERLAPLGCSLGSPRDAARRGAHVAIRHPDARTLAGELIQRGVVPDFREPDSIRFGLPPLSTRYEDVALGVAALESLLR